MKSAKNLRLQLRLTQAALLVVFGLSLSAAVSTHQLLLDAANHPASPFDLTSTNITGTLDPARLDPGVPLLSGGNLILPGTLSVSGSTFLDDGLIGTDGSGSFYSIKAQTFFDYFGDLILDSNGGGTFTSLTSLGALAVSSTTVLDGGSISTDGSGNLSCVTVKANAGIAMFGKAPVSTQPATPTTLAGVVSVLQTYGLCQ